MKPRYVWSYLFKVWVRRDKYLDPKQYPYWLSPNAPWPSTK